MVKQFRVSGRLMPEGTYSDINVWAKGVAVENQRFQAAQALAFLGVIVSNTVICSLITAVVCIFGIYLIRILSVYGGDISEHYNFIKQIAIVSISNWAIDHLFLNRFVADGTVITHRACFDFCDFFLTFYKVIYGALSAIIRLAVIAAVSLGSMFLLDRSALPASISGLDSGYASFVSMLLLQEKQANPAMRAATELIASIDYDVYLHQDRIYGTDRKRRIKPSQVEMLKGSKETAFKKSTRGDIPDSLSCSYRSWRQFQVFNVLACNPSLKTWNNEGQAKNPLNRVVKDLLGEYENKELISQCIGVSNSQSMHDVLLKEQLGHLRTAFALIDKDEDGLIGIRDLMYHFQEKGNPIDANHAANIVESISVFEKGYFNHKNINEIARLRAQKTTSKEMDRLPEETSSILLPVAEESHHRIDINPKEPLELKRPSSALQEADATIKMLQTMPSNTGKDSSNAANITQSSDNEASDASERAEPESPEAEPPSPNFSLRVWEGRARARTVWERAPPVSKEDNICSKIWNWTKAFIGSGPPEKMGPVNAATSTPASPIPPTSEAPEIESRFSPKAHAAAHTKSLRSVRITGISSFDDNSSANDEKFELVVEKNEAKGFDFVEFVAFLTWRTAEAEIGCLRKLIENDKWITVDFFTSSIALRFMEVENTDPEILGHSKLKWKHLLQFLFVNGFLSGVGHLQTWEVENLMRFFAKGHVGPDLSPAEITEEEEVDPQSMQIPIRQIAKIIQLSSFGGPGAASILLTYGLRSCSACEQSKDVPLCTVCQIRDAQRCFACMGPGDRTICKRCTQTIADDTTF